MVRGMIAALVLAATVSAPLRAGDFDYWLLALSWSPSWCATEARGPAEQCDPARDLGFVLHGLWPQYEDGWPEYCTTPARDPSRRQTAAMADVMGSGGLAWHQWKKHGRCSGLEADAYFDLSRLAFTLTARPDLDPRMTAEEIEDAFLAANPGLEAEHLVVTCRDGLVREVRLCLTRDLAPRTCGADVERGSCRARGALAVPPIP
jgi:ribonuclease T2